MGRIVCQLNLELDFMTTQSYRQAGQADLLCFPGEADAMLGCQFAQGKQESLEGWEVPC